MGACVSSPPPERANQPATSAISDGRTGINNAQNNSKNNVNLYKPIGPIARNLEYPRARNEVINNTYSMNDWIEVKERISMKWVVATIIDKQNNWIRILSQSPNMQFTDKLHIIRDRSRIRQLGSGSNDGNTDTPKDDSINNFDKMLDNNGLSLIYEIKYDEADSTIDTIYKSFEYKLFRNHHDINNNDEFKQNVLNFINDEDNEEFLNENISNWSQCKDNNDLLTDKDYLIVLSHFCKLNIIGYGYDKFDANDNDNDDLQIIFEHKYSEINDDLKDDNNIRLLYISKTKQYKLMGLTMSAITKLIDNNQDVNNNENENENENEHDNDYRNWNVDQILKWLNIIECGLFNDAKYDNLREGIQKLDIDGSNVSKVNDLTLRSLGVDDEFDVKLLVDNIEKLILTKKQQNSDNSSPDNNNNNNDIIEEEQEIDNNLEGGYVTPGGDGSNDYVGFVGGGAAGKQQQGRGTMNVGGDYFEIPEEYLDPIHYTIMRDPVLSIVSGHTFERESITEWINSNGTDPINQKALNLNQLVPNRTLREAIDRFVKIYGSENTETKR